MERLKHFGEQKAVRIVALLLGDIVLLTLAQFLALFVRFEFDITMVLKERYWEMMISFAPVYIVMCLVVFWVVGLYRSLWKYISVREALLIVQAAAIVGVLQYFFMNMLEMQMPRSFPVLNILFLTLFLGAERFSYRFFRSMIHNRVNARTQARTMLIGAGEAGAAVLRELNNSDRSNNHIVCIIDDGVRKQGMTLNGVPIVGSREMIPEMAEKYMVEEIIFAIPSCGAEDRRAILQLCQQTRCAIKTLPGLAEIANGEVRIEKLRSVAIEDLLGRDSVRVDMAGIARHIKGKTVLVTGGGGSIGSELCRQLASAKPERLIIFDIYENNAYDIQQELIMNGVANSDNLKVLIASVRDRKKMQRIFEAYHPEIVFHAAAHKHVPLMEVSPEEAVKNNVLGTYNVALLSDEYKVKKFVLVSTDKAVNPTNVMGATKRYCEMIVQNFSRTKQNTEYVAVRFGNVLGSNGSVIPLFKKQIESGKPVTITHPDIIRYFMTIPEAVSLILTAGSIAHGGEIFVLDMGEPVKILTLAENLIKVYGKKPYEDVDIIFTGLRPGEKLYEELLMSEEGLQKTDNQKVFIGTQIDIDDETLEAGLAALKRASDKNDSAAVVKVLEKYVPTFQHKTNQ